MFEYSKWYIYVLRKILCIDYVTHVESRKNLSIVDDGKSICIKIHDPIVDTYISVKKTTIVSSCKNNKKERKEKKKGGKKSEDVDDNLISEIIAIVTGRAICNLLYVMLASCIDAEKGSSAISSELRSPRHLYHTYFRLANDIYRAAVITVVRVTATTQHGFTASYSNDLSSARKIGTES